jgi:hypothetical protein
LEPATGAWHTDVDRAKTWRDLNSRRVLEISEHCAAAAFRAVFTWILRDVHGVVVSLRRRCRQDGGCVQRKLGAPPRLSANRGKHAPHHPTPQRTPR